ncbi:MAG: hypothetical protein HDT02_03315 [Bacteroidales bacterium]|nr:hypothetical protein [Bacteroidales bacterium]
MGIWGSAIGAGLSAIGSIFGGSAASKAMRNVKKNLNERIDSNRNWYDRRYNEDATQRADAQRILAKTEEMIKNRNRAAAGAAAVNGGTSEAAVAQIAMNNEAFADAASRISAEGDRRKDTIESQYLGREDALQSELRDLERQKAANVAAATQGVIEAGSKMGDLF